MPLSQSYPDYLSTLLSFRSMFRLNVTPAFDVFDSQGLIQSQVVCNDDSSFQLAFDASDAQSTASARFMQNPGWVWTPDWSTQWPRLMSCTMKMKTDSSFNFMHCQ